MLNKAIKLAHNITSDKHKVVAIITDKRNRILSIGINNYLKSHPKQLYYAKKTGNRQKIYLHAEIDALIRCKHKPYKIFIARVNNEGKPMISKPCSLCSLALKDYNIKEIYHT